MGFNYVCDAMRSLQIILFLLLLNYSFSQGIKVKYNIEGIENIENSPVTKFKDSIALQQYLSVLQKNAWEANYLEFSIDEIVSQNGEILINGEIGQHYENIHLKLEEKEYGFLKRKVSHHKDEIWISKLTPSNINKRINAVVNIYADNGYPFCNIEIESIQIRGDSFQGSLVIERGVLNTWKKIHVKGDSSLNTNFIQSLINIKVDDLYNESEIRKISSTINNTPYLAELSPPELLFTKEGAELFLYLENVPRSSINGIIGFQPNPISGRLNFTGDVRLNLLNVLKHGERLNLNWQSVAQQTQSLNSAIAYPYLFNTPFGIEGKFNLYKRDSSFLETFARAGVTYNLKPNWNISVFYARNSSNLLSGTYQQDDRSTVRTNAYGIGSENVQLDYLPNPSKGYYFEANVQGGIRSFQTADTLPAEKDQTLRSELKVGVFVPIGPRHVLRFENQSAFYFAEDIFSNELYRFGGLLEQRGFNEDELLASSRATFTAEYRFLLDKNSNVFAFYDLSWYESKTINYVRDIPMGAGLGFSFSSNVGVFNLAYAIGKHQDNGFQLANSKIHFGYTALF
jgi:outer membrane protein assembly factor BamA